MGLNYSVLVYSPCFDMFARPVTIVPQLGASFSGRGIYDSRSLNVVADDGSIFSDQDTILDIREAEFPTLPVQGDHVIIPSDFDVPAEGEFIVKDTWHNGGGEMTLTLMKYV